MTVPTSIIESTQQHGLAPSDLVTVGDDKQCSEEAPDFVNGYDEGLDCALIVRLGHLREGPEEDGLRDDAAHHALVMPEEKES